MSGEPASNVDADAAILAALDTFITTQRTLIARQLADVDRLQTLKTSLHYPHDHDHDQHDHNQKHDLLTRITSTLAADPTFALSTHADLALNLPPALDWTAFARCDPAPVRALAAPRAAPAPASVPLSGPGPFPHAVSNPGPNFSPRVGPNPAPAPPSELQTLVRHAARTLLAPRMRRYPRVPTPSPSASGDECDPVAARRAREHARIRELREIVRRGGGGGLRTMRMGLIRTDIGEEAMRSDVQIDDDDDKGGWPGKGKTLSKTPSKGRTPHTSKHAPRGKTVPAAYLLQDQDHADEGDDNSTAQPAPSHATKNLGLVAAHAARSAAASPAQEVDLNPDAGLEVKEDMAVDADQAVLDRNFEECVPVPMPKSRLKPAPKSKSRAKAKPGAKFKAKLKSPSKRAKKASYEYTDDDDDDNVVLAHHCDVAEEDEAEEEPTEYKDPSSFVPSVTVYPSSSSSSGEDAVENVNTHMDLDADLDMDLDTDLDTMAKAKAKPPKKNKKQKDKRRTGDTFSADDDPDGGDADGAAPATAKRKTKPSKPKPPTYNLPWSTAEQHHLEQLLEEIPDGARFRWQQISRAMGGRRTPRQVASRVQKYFEKLRKYDLMG